MICIIDWQDSASLKNFKNSIQWNNYLDLLTSLCVEGTVPKIQSFDIHLGAAQGRMTPFTSMTDYHFWPDICDDERIRLSQIRGLSERSVPAKDQDVGYNARWHRGWSYSSLYSSSESQFEGEPTFVMRVLDFWRDGKEEEDFKRKSGVIRPGKKGQLSESKLFWDMYLEELGEFGMRGVDEMYVDFQRLYTYPDN
jgi:hypothetical protein